MSRDGLLPKVFSSIHPVFRTPAFSTWVAGFVVAIPSGLFDIGTLANLSNIGTLFAFVLVSIGVIVLRYREPERKRGFRVPFGPVIPALSVIFCFLLMAGLDIITWLRFLIWLVIGLVIYFFYSRHRSEFAPPADPLHTRHVILVEQGYPLSGLCLQRELRSRVISERAAWGPALAQRTWGKRSEGPAFLSSRSQHEIAHRTY